MKRLLFCTVILAFLVGCTSTAPPESAIQTAIAQTQVAQPAVATPKFTNTVFQAPTNTPEPSNTPPPTNTPEPTNTPAPTNTPVPTDTPVPPTATPEPIYLKGSGDSIVDTNNPFEVAIIHIKGNAAGRYFGVKNYGSDGQNIDLLVNTTEPYDGVRPLDFELDKHTTRLEITAVGTWEVWIQPVTAARVLNVPGAIEGKGDDVIILSGATPDLAKIKGNSEGRYFGVIGYSGESSDLLVNTTDPYEGTVMVSSGVFVLEIQAIGNWSIEVTST
jgi:hypothetical protein